MVIVCSNFRTLQLADFNNQLFIPLRSIYNQECARLERVDPLLAAIYLVTLTHLAVIALPLTPV